MGTRDGSRACRLYLLNLLRGTDISRSKARRTRRGYAASTGAMGAYEALR